MRNTWVLRRQGREVGRVVLEDGVVRARLPAELHPSIRWALLGGYMSYVFDLGGGGDRKRRARRLRDPWYWEWNLRGLMSGMEPRLWDEVESDPPLELPKVPEGAIP